MFPVLLNVVGYARTLGTMDEARLKNLIAQVEKAKARGEFMMIYPQFLATATA